MTRRVAPADRAVPGGDRILQRIFTRLGCDGRPPQFVVEFHPYTDLTHTIRLREQTAYVRISDALRDAPIQVVEGAAAMLLGRLYRRRVPKDTIEAYREFSYARGTREKLAEQRKRRARRSEHRPAGMYFDLEPMFDSLNRRYFEGALEKPRLGWSKRVWRSQLGCFDPALRQIVINRQLDRERVPECAVAYVLYHEMLHVKHPIKFARCRRQSHSAEFRREEKKFAEYARAMKFLHYFPAD